MNMDRINRNFFLYSATIIVLLIAVYVGSYISFRSRHIEVWERDNQRYVIFPKDRVILYYVYRPLSHIDAKLTGMRFHIGPHRGDTS
jgi:hypothetical protein